MKMVLPNLYHSKNQHMAKDEVEPNHRVQSKGLIKVVFLSCAVARRRPGFDGKIGIWSFSKYQEAPCRSKKQEEGYVIKAGSFDKENWCF